MSEEMTPELRRETVWVAVTFIDESPHWQVMRALKKAGISKERRENLRVFRDALVVASASDNNVGAYNVAYNILKVAKLI